MIFYIKVVNCLTNSIALDPASIIIDGTVLTNYFGENFDTIFNLTSTYAWSGLEAGICSVDHYRIRCIDPAGDDYVHQDGIVFSNDSLLCDKNIFVSDTSP